MASILIEAAALSRPFTLGMLYDARKEQIIPGATLWDEKALQQMTVENYQPSSNFEITTFDSLDEKSSMLDVSASLKASFLGGLIELEGSAKYLSDKKQSHNQSRVTFQYKATTAFKQLMIPPASAQNIHQIDNDVKSLATHVVTGILYGANAVFVFDSDKVEASNVQNIEGGMHALIKKIPSFSVDGKVDIKMTDEEKDLTNKFTCKFFGDFILESNPASFEEAVKTYVELPKLLGDKKENGVPLKVWMMPLKSLSPVAAELKDDLSPHIVRKVQDALEDLHDLQMRCNDCVDASYHFSQMQKKLSSFQKLCFSYKAKLQEILAEKIPSIRAGECDERKLEDLFVNKTSLFNTEELKKWMDHTEREVTVIQSCMKMMENGKIIPKESQLDAEVFDPTAEDVVCFVFTSLETTDPFIQKMFDRLDSLDPTSPEEDLPSPQDLWYYSDEVITKMREKAQMFNVNAQSLKDNKRYRFLIAAITDENHKGATVYQYINTIKLTDDFLLPAVEEITDRRQLIQYEQSLHLDPDTAQSTLILSEENKMVTCGEKQIYPDLPQRFDDLPQVLCKEALEKVHYWEVKLADCEDCDVGVGICYYKLGRKGKGDLVEIGRNAMSWSLRCKDRLNPAFNAWYDNMPFDHSGPLFTFHSLAVYLNYPKGILSFYIVKDDQLHHIHTFSTKFSEPVYPCFSINAPNSGIELIF